MSGTNPLAAPTNAPQNAFASRATQPMPAPQQNALMAAPASPAAPAAAPSAAPTASAPDMHAQIGAGLRAQQIPPGEVDKRIGDVMYAYNEFSKLASDPDATTKDLIKATADAVGKGKAKPEMAVGMLSSAPDDPKKLHDWLQSQALMHLSALVHLKMMKLQNAAQAHPQGAAGLVADMHARQGAPVPGAAMP